MVPVYTVTRGSSQQYQVALNVEDLGDQVLLEAQDPETGDVLKRNRRKVDKDRVDKVRKRGEDRFAHWCLRQIWLEPVT